MNALQDLIKEYKKSLRLLRTANTVPLHYSSMVSDTQYAIEIMTTGKIPGTKWTIARWPVVKREIPVDPQVMAKYVSDRKPVEPAPDGVVQLLEEVLSELTEREREAYRLVRGEKFSFSQAAKFMGCKKGSVQNFVARAEKKIGVVVRKQTISERVCHY